MASIRSNTSQAWGRCSIAAIVAAVAALAFAATAAAAPIADEAAAIYDPGAVATIDLTLSPEAIAALEAEPSEYVKGTFAMASTSGGPGGEETALAPPRSVEVRLKGSGSFRPITGKAAFKLKFKKAEAFLGLRKMTLNNMVQDESMAHEALSYLAFGAFDVPAPRSGYAYLRLNGEDVGLYADVETLDKVALEKRFGTFEDPPQHLYEGESGDDVLEGGAAGFEADEGDEEDRSDLEALIDAVNGDAAVPFGERVAETADLEEMVRMWAVEHYLVHWDGYSGHREPGLRPNNYYLFSDAAGRFQMLPWGTDQTWDLNLEIPHRIIEFDSEGGLMFNECLADPDCYRLYWEALGDVTEAIEVMDAGTVLTGIEAMLAPWQAKEREDGRATASEAQVTAQTNESANFIAGRPEEVRDWLAAHEPPEPEEEEPGEEEETGEEQDEGPGNKPKDSALEPILLPAPPAPAGDAMHLGRIVKKPRAIVLRLGFAEAGELRVRATMGPRSRTVTACNAHAKVSSAGRISISCDLTPRALERLAKRATRFQVRATFVSAQGRESAERSIRVPAS